MIKHRVSGFALPIQVLDKKHSVQNTVANASLWIELPIDEQHPSSDHLVSLIQSYHGQMTIDGIPEMLSKISRRFNAAEIGLVLDFPYFIESLTGLA